MPSAYSGISMLGKQRAGMAAGGSSLLSDVDPKQRSIVLTMIGDGVNPGYEDRLVKQLAKYGLHDTKLKVRSATEAKFDVNLLRERLQKDLLGGVVATTKENSARIAALEARDKERKIAAIDIKGIEAEIRALHPTVKILKVTTGAPTEPRATDRTVLLVALDQNHSLSAGDLAKLKHWLVTRFPDAEVNVVVGREI